MGAINGYRLGWRKAYFCNTVLAQLSTEYKNTQCSCICTCYDRSTGSSLHAAVVLQEALAQHTQHAATARQGGWAAAAPLAAAPQAAAAPNASKKIQVRGAASASAQASPPSEHEAAMEAASEAAAKQPRPGWLHRFLSEQLRCLRCCLPATGTAYGL